MYAIARGVRTPHLVNCLGVVLCCVSLLLFHPINIMLQVRSSFLALGGSFSDSLSLTCLIHSLSVGGDGDDDEFSNIIHCLN